MHMEGQPKPPYSNRCKPALQTAGSFYPSSSDSCTAACRRRNRSASSVGKGARKREAVDGRIGRWWVLSIRGTQWQMSMPTRTLSRAGAACECTWRGDANR